MMTNAEYSRRWRLKNPERSREIIREWRLKNPDKVKATDKRWRNNHPDKTKAADKKWKSNHSDKVKEIAATYHRKHREHILQHKRDGRFKKYGLTENAFYALLAGQGGACAICGTSTWGGQHGVPIIDHDHESGDIRGLLCNTCNLAAGLLGDNPEKVQLLLTYLRDKRRT